MTTGESVRTATAPATSAPSWFAELLAHRRWIRRTKPFPHIYVRDVFVPEFYRRLADEFDRVLREQPDAFGSVAEGYSATGISLTKLRDGPLAVFLSPEWHDMIAGVTGESATGDVEGSLHHHQPGSPAGWPHNDLNPAWFPGDPPGPGEIRVPGPGVNVKTGPSEPGVTARETVRAVAVLFYLGNPGWQPGDGGETALYEHVAASGPAPVTLVPPLDNSMVIFECTPRSWHTYLGNNAAARNSVIMWLHRPKDDAVRQWGGDRIVKW